MKMHYTIILVTFFFLGMSQAFAQNGTATLTIDVEPAATVEAGEKIDGRNGDASWPTVSVENGGINSVTVTLSDEVGFASGTYTQDFDGEDKAEFDDLVIETAGTYTMVFDVGVASATSQEFKVNSAAAASFTFSVDDITAGENADIEINNAEDEFSNALDGIYSVTFSIADNGYDVTDDLTFEAGTASHTTVGLTTSTGTYTLEVDIDGITVTETFTISSAEADDFGVEVEDITAGKDVVIDITEAKDEFENSLDGDYEANIAIHDNSEKYNATETLTFTAGTVSHTVADLTTAGTYTVTVEIDDTSN
ncbi:MAG: hypothetical protein R6U62_01035, partial [Bacteroidales bacterium]